MSPRGWLVALAFALMVFAASPRGSQIEACAVGFAAALSLRGLFETEED